MAMTTTPPQAAARIAGGVEAPELRGTVRFFPMWDGVLVEVRLRGLPEKGSGFFALHIHEGARCSGREFSDTGGHYDPAGKLHPSHTGDLPPLIRCCGGRAYLAVVTNRFSIQDIIGRTVVIHSDPDDFESQPAGNAGKKIGCGVIYPV